MEDRPAASRPPTCVWRAGPSGSAVWTARDRRHTRVWPQGGWQCALCDVQVAPRRSGSPPRAVESARMRRAQTSGALSLCDDKFNQSSRRAGQQVRLGCGALCAAQAAPSMQSVTLEPMGSRRASREPPAKALRLVCNVRSTRDGQHEVSMGAGTLASGPPSRSRSRARGVKLVSGAAANDRAPSAQIWFTARSMV